MVVSRANEFLENDIDGALVSYFTKLEDEKREEGGEVEARRG